MWEALEMLLKIFVRVLRSHTKCIKENVGPRNSAKSLPNKQMLPLLNGLDKRELEQSGGCKTASSKVRLSAHGTFSCGQPL
jgi:hypothetical protein